MYEYYVQQPLNLNFTSLVGRSITAASRFTSNFFSFFSYYTSFTFVLCLILLQFIVSLYSFSWTAGIFLSCFNFLHFESLTLRFWNLCGNCFLYTILNFLYNEFLTLDNWFQRREQNFNSEILVSTKGRGVRCNFKK